MAQGHSERGGGWEGRKPPQLGQRLTCSWGLSSRFLKIPGKITQDKGSPLEQLQGQKQDKMGFKAEMLEVSP